jgi:hypothetical protein
MSKKITFSYGDRTLKLSPSISGSTLIEILSSHNDGARNYGYIEGPDQAREIISAIAEATGLGVQMREKPKPPLYADLVGKTVRIVVNKDDWSAEPNGMVFISKVIGAEQQELRTTVVEIESGEDHRGFKTALKVGSPYAPTHKRILSVTPVEQVYKPVWEER